MRTSTTLVACAALAVATACDGEPTPRRGEPEPAAEPAPATDAAAAPALETVARGLDTPWDLAFAPDGRIFVTERAGRIRVIEDGALRESSWATLDVAETGEAGLMGVAVGPDFAETGYVYVYGTFRGPGGLENRIVRLTDGGGRGTEPTVVVDGLPAARFHAGGALDFGPDGLLYATTGDAGDPDAAQNPESLRGKVLRYTPGGRVPAGNPFRGSPVYALGLRNPQGLDRHPETGDLFATDHGPSRLPREGFQGGHDELNVILPGRDYGWPEAVGMEEHGDRFVPPIAVWTPAIAPSGLTVYTGRELPWTGDVFVGGLRGEQLRRVALERAPDSPTGWRVTAQEAMYEDDLGRIRAVVTGPDGALYFTTSNRDGRGDPGPEDDRVLRLAPGG